MHLSFVQALRHSVEEYKHKEPFQLFIDNTNTAPVFTLKLS
uniref:Uncharacterized protein n=1 Tax=Moniliophthora roreri TaxID=221103 RepID=A0A0W0EV13_MONRR